MATQKVVASPMPLKIYIPSRGFQIGVAATSLCHLRAILQAKLGLTEKFKLTLDDGTIVCDPEYFKLLERQTKLTVIEASPISRLHGVTANEQRKRKSPCLPSAAKRVRASPENCSGDVNVDLNTNQNNSQLLSKISISSVAGDVSMAPPTSSSQPLSPQLQLCQPSVNKLPHWPTTSSAPAMMPAAQQSFPQHQSQSPLLHFPQGNQTLPPPSNQVFTFPRPPPHNPPLLQWASRGSRCTPQFIPRFIHPQSREIIYQQQPPIYPLYQRNRGCRDQLLQMQVEQQMRTAIHMSTPANVASQVQLPIHLAPVEPSIHPTPCFAQQPITVQPPIHHAAQPLTTVQPPIQLAAQQSVPLTTVQPPIQLAVQQPVPLTTVQQPIQLAVQQPVPLTTVQASIQPAAASVQRSARVTMHPSTQPAVPPLSRTAPVTVPPSSRVPPTWPVPLQPSPVTVKSSIQPPPAAVQQAIQSTDSSPMQPPSVQPNRITVQSIISPAPVTVQASIRPLIVEQPSIRPAPVTVGQHMPTPVKPSIHPAQVPVQPPIPTRTVQPSVQSTVQQAIQSTSVQPIRTTVQWSAPVTMEQPSIQSAPVTVQEPISAPSIQPPIPSPTIQSIILIPPVSRLPDGAHAVHVEKQFQTPKSPPISLKVVSASLPDAKADYNPDIAESVLSANTTTAEDVVSEEVDVEEVDSEDELGRLRIVESLPQLTPSPQPSPSATVHSPKIATPKEKLCKPDKLNLSQMDDGYCSATTSSIGSADDVKKMLPFANFDDFIPLHSCCNEVNEQVENNGQDLPLAVPQDNNNCSVTEESTAESGQETQLESSCYDNGVPEEEAVGSLVVTLPIGLIDGQIYYNQYGQLHDRITVKCKRGVKDSNKSEVIFIDLECEKDSDSDVDAMKHVLDSSKLCSSRDYHKDSRRDDSRNEIEDHDNVETVNVTVSSECIQNDVANEEVVVAEHGAEVPVVTTPLDCGTTLISIDQCVADIIRAATSKERGELKSCNNSFFFSESHTSVSGIEKAYEQSEIVEENVLLESCNLQHDDTEELMMGNEIVLSTEGSSQLQLYDDLDNSKFISNLLLHSCLPHNGGRVSL